MINKKLFLQTAAAICLMACASQAWSAPVYIGLQEAGVNSDDITNESGVNGGSGSASFINTYGNVTDGLFSLNVSASGTPPLPEPNLLSNAVTATASHPGTIWIYITELNQFPVNFGDFQNIFGATTLGAGITVVESTYVHDCSNGANQPCSMPAAGPSNVYGDAFQTTTLLSSTTLTSAGSVTTYVTPPTEATVPYAETEVYEITFTQQNTSVTASIGLKAPEPASIAVLGTALFGLGAIKRRRRKSS